MSRNFKVIAAAIVVTVLIWCSVLPFGAIEVVRAYGDVDNDAYVTTEDARLVLQVAAGINDTALYGLDFDAADLDGDGVSALNYLYRQGAYFFTSSVEYQLSNHSISVSVESKYEVSTLSLYIEVVSHDRRNNRLSYTNSSEAIHLVINEQVEIEVGTFNLSTSRSVSCLYSIC